MIPVDFEKASFREKLAAAGFDKTKPSLFILEGLIMYLTEEAIDETFRLISDFTSPGSHLVFDHIYTSVLRFENRYYDERQVYTQVKKNKEQWVFGIEEGQINNFLKTYHLSLLEHLDAPALDQKYFTNQSGTIITQLTAPIVLFWQKKRNVVNPIFQKIRIHLIYFYLN